MISEARKQSMAHFGPTTLVDMRKRNNTITNLVPRGFLFLTAFSSSMCSKKQEGSEYEIVQ